jgi:hemolysin III
MAAELPAKPKLRGVFHEAGFYAAVLAGAPLVWAADAGRARLSALVFSACLALCFGASALYHRPTWRPQVRAWLARLDHAGVYLLIAGSYTPFALLVFTPAWAVSVLALVWGGALAAIVLKAVWLHAPKTLAAAIAIALGWVSVAALPQLLRLPVPAVLLVVGGGVLYTAGAVVYMRRRPRLVPSVFGYHELFHVLTLAAAGCHGAAIAVYVLPRG